MDAFCRSESVAVGEPIGGSAAAHTDVWLALEHDCPWGAAAVLESGLAAPVAERLMALQSGIEGARVQLIRLDPRACPGATVGGEGATFIVAVTGLGQQRAVRMTLPSHEALLALDVPALVRALRTGAPVASAEAITKPIVLVCTNGKRDRCCAKWGLPIYRALAAREDVECWQTTHLGGHRFAPTLVALPSGLCYGRLAVHDLEMLVAAIQEDRVFEPLRALRGRTCLSAAEQLAEVHWRHQVGEMRNAALVTVSSVETPDGTTVTMLDDAGTQHRFVVQRKSLGAIAHPSCAKDPKDVFGLFATPAPAESR